MCDTSNRITVLLGAGATADIQGASTKEITDRVKRIDDDILRFVIKRMDEYYGEGKYNFEDIYHTLELLLSYCGLNNTDVEGEDKLHLSPFITPQEKCGHLFETSNVLAIKETVEKVIKAITQCVYNKNDADDLHSGTSRLVTDSQTELAERRQAINEGWFGGFWRSLSEIYKMDICKLNYDDYLELCLQEKYEDGFSKNGYTKPFETNNIVLTKENRLFHLHGSILFGFNDDTIKKCWEYQVASESLLTTNRSQDNSRYINAPIISGLNKTNRVFQKPFSIYLQLFMQALIINPRLLIIGYSFNDIYINELLELFIGIHGLNGKVAIIDKLNATIYKEYFVLNKELKPNPLYSKVNNNICHFIVHAFNRTNPFESYSDQSYIQSPNGCVRVYLSGFKNAVMKNDKELMEYLFKL